MKLQVDGLFFIGKQLVAISNTGKVVVWQSVQKHWQHQEVEPICSYDTAGFFLLLGCTNGSIYYIGQCYSGIINFLRGDDHSFINYGDY